MPAEGSFGAIGDGHPKLEVNPFFSDKLKESIALRASRPMGLPPTPVVETDGTGWEFWKRGHF